MRLLCFLVTLALYARAYSATSLEPSSIDFEAYEFGAENVHLGVESDNRYHWFTAGGSSQVKTKVVSSVSGQGLDIAAPDSPALALARTMVAREDYSAAIESVLVGGDCDYSEIYCDLTAVFTEFASEDEPIVDGEDRVLVWARDGRLMVTAGRYLDSMYNVLRVDYPIASPTVDLSVAHRLTIRSIADISLGRKALGFAIYIDGVPAVIESGYPVSAGFDIRDEICDAARLLLDSKRLFPSLTVPGQDRSIAVSSLQFTGLGSVDDLAFATNAPAAFAAPERLFELRWDRGVTSLVYRVGTGINTRVASERLADCKLVLAVPEEGEDVAVSALYDTANEYTPGLWKTEGNCVIVTNIVGNVTNQIFRVGPGVDESTGIVASYRGEISVGAGGVATFAEAKENAKAQGLKSIVLGGDVVTVVGEYPYLDNGSFVVEVDEDFILDLNGHTLSNGVGESATIVNRGKLRIIDSAGGGKVVPFADYFGDGQEYERDAVQNAVVRKRSVPPPVLEIAGGTFDGAVNNGSYHDTVSDTDVAGVISIERNTAVGGEPAFISDNGYLFPYDEYLADRTLYYAYTEPYWQPVTNAFIWCGNGSGDSWEDPMNWRNQAFPGAGDLAVFPAATNVWEADMGAGIAVRDLRFDGDVILHGNADFTSVAWETKASGRVSGDAKLTWSGVLPPSLSTLLAEDWAGTVVIAEVGANSPKLLSAIESWGTASSKVVFRGVRGYYHTTANRVMSYTLVLETGSKGYGWKNDAGFTGSVLTFAALSGSGSFVSPKNTIANLQLIRFLDVYGYRGVLDVKGKRVVLGDGEVSTLEPGSITWSDGVRVYSHGATNSCAVAVFAGALSAYAYIGEALVKYSDSVVGAESVVVEMLSAGGLTAELCTTNPSGSVVFADWSDDASIVDGRRVAQPVLTMAKSTSAIYATSPAAAKALKFANIYTASVGGSVGGFTMVTLSLNENAVPVIGGEGESAAVTIEDGMAKVIVSNAKPGLWYGLQGKDTLDAEWPEVSPVWQSLNENATDGRLELTLPVEESGTSGFFRVIVTDVEPPEEVE